MRNSRKELDRVNIIHLMISIVETRTREKNRRGGSRVVIGALPAADAIPSYLNDLSNGRIPGIRPYDKERNLDASRIIGSIKRIGSILFV